MAQCRVCESRLVLEQKSVNRTLISFPSSSPVGNLAEWRTYNLW